jgi:uncharacterized protein YgfB (UPF0149 family)
VKIEALKEEEKGRSTELDNPFYEPKEVEPKASEPEQEPEPETSYVRKKIVFRKTLMPPSPGQPQNFGYSSMQFIPGQGESANDMNFGFNSISGIPSDFGSPHASNNAKAPARPNITTSLDNIKNRFPLNPDGYLQVTSGTELRTIIGRAIASNGQATFPGIQVGPFCFDFENGVWKLNIQKGSNEIGPRSESKEEYIEELRKKKQKAIEEEDYTLASFLKHKEQIALTAESEVFVLPGGVVLCYRNSKWEITECPSQPGLVYLQPAPKKEVPPPTTLNAKLTSSILNPLQSLQNLIDNVVQVDPEDNEALELLTQLEEAVSIIVVHFKDTTAPTRPLTPTPPAPTQSTNFSQVLVTNLTRNNSPTPSFPSSPTTINKNTNNNPRTNMYTSNTLTADSPYTVINTSTTYKYTQTTPPPNNNAKNSNAATAIAAAAAATNAKKLNALVRGKFCTALAGVLANGLKKQFHILSITEPHMWDFVEECGAWPKQSMAGLALGQSIRIINSAMQDSNMKYRSLICDALNTKNLKEWLQLMMSYEPVTEKYFEDYALIRHKGVFQKYIDCVARLADLPFDLDVMYEAKLAQQRNAQAQAQVQTHAQEPAQVLANIGSLFSSFLAPKSEDENSNTGEEQKPKEKPKGLFGLW